MLVIRLGNTSLFVEEWNNDTTENVRDIGKLICEDYELDIDFPNRMLFELLNLLNLASEILFIL